MLSCCTFIFLLIHSVSSFVWLFVFIFIFQLSLCSLVWLFFFHTCPYRLPVSTEKWKNGKKEKEKNSHHLENITGIGQKSKFLAFKRTIEPPFFKLKDCFRYGFMLIFLTYFWHFYWPILCPSSLPFSV